MRLHQLLEFGRLLEDEEVGFVNDDHLAPAHGEAEI
jgi:hypothetical protein